MAALGSQQPRIIDHDFGAIRAGKLALADDVWFVTTAGAPTGGAGWAGIGSKAIDITNGVDYINTGTKASPTWTIVGTQS